MGKLWIKLLISLSILAYILLVKVKLKVLAHLVGKISPWWFFLGLSLHILGYIISGERWRRISAHLGVKLPLKFYVKSYLVSTFFGFFLPSRFGGDLVRIGDLTTREDLSSGLSTVFYERVVGLVSMVSLGLPALLLIRPEFKRFFLLSLLLMGGVFLLSLLVILKPGLLPAVIPFRRLKKKAEEVGEALERLKHKGLFLTTLAWSFALQFNVIIYYWAIGKAVGLKIPFLHYFFLIPTMLILMALPISFQGMGIRDFFAVSVFPLYGAVPEQGLLFSLSDLAIALAYAVVGFFVYIGRK